MREKFINNVTINIYRDFYLINRMADMFKMLGEFEMKPEKLFDIQYYSAVQMEQIRTFCKNGFNFKIPEWIYGNPNIANYFVNYAFPALFGYFSTSEFIQMARSFLILNIQCSLFNRLVSIFLVRSVPFLDSILSLRNESVVSIERITQKVVDSCYLFDQILFNVATSIDNTNTGILVDDLGKWLTISRNESKHISLMDPKHHITFPKLLNNSESYLAYLMVLTPHDMLILDAILNSNVPNFPKSLSNILLLSPPNNEEHIIFSNVDFPIMDSFKVSSYNILIASMNSYINLFSNANDWDINNSIIFLSVLDRKISLFCDNPRLPFTIKPFLSQVIAIHLICSTIEKGKFSEHFENPFFRFLTRSIDTYNPNYKIILRSLLKSSKHYVNLRFLSNFSNMCEKVEDEEFLFG